MLRKSFAYADLRLRSHQALGRERLRRDFDMSALAAAYAANLSPVSPRTFEADIPETDFQMAMIGDMEAAFDRCVAQSIAYGYLLSGGVDPSWTAVTGYYAAFFGVRLLNTMLGLGARRLPPAGLVPAGLYRYSTRPSVYSGRVILVLRKVGSASHNEVWKAFVHELDALAGVPGLDNRSRSVLQALAPVIRQPTLPSDFRNHVNYGLEDAWARPGWATFLREVPTTDVETLILRSVGLADEQRVELALLSAVSLSADLYADYLATASRPDRRRGDARRSLLTAMLAGGAGAGLKAVFRAT